MPLDDKNNGQLREELADTNHFEYGSCPPSQECREPMIQYGKGKKPPRVEFIHVDEDDSSDSKYQIILHEGTPYNVE